MIQETENNFFQNLFFLEWLEKIIYPCLKHQDVAKKKNNQKQKSSCKLKYNYWNKKFS